MAFVKVTEQAVSPGASGAWTDVDCSAYIPASATGVVLRVELSAGGLRMIGLRKNGSTDDRYFDMFAAGATGDGVQWVEIGVDGSQIFEAKLEDYTQFTITLIGYHTDNATFNTNAPSYSPTAASFNDVDISSDTGAETAIGAIFEVTSSALLYVGFRNNGSSHTRTQDVDRHVWMNIGVDGSEICECNRESTGVNIYLVGWITKNASYKTTEVDVSFGSTGSWIEMTASQTAVAQIIQVIHQDTADSFGLRNSDSSDGSLWDGSRKIATGVIPSDNSIIDGHITDVTTDFYVVGYYTSATAAASVATSTAAAKWTLPATKQIIFEKEWDATASNGDTIAYQIFKDGSEQTSGSLNMQTLGGQYNDLKTLSDLASGTFKLALNNISSGGKVQYKKARAYYVRSDGFVGDRFREASTTTLHSHTMDFDDNSVGWESSGVYVLDDQTGIRFDAQNSHAQFLTGTVDDQNLEVHWIPDSTSSSATNNLVLMLRGDKNRENRYTCLYRNQYKQIKMYKTVNNNTSELDAVSLSVNPNVITRYQFNIDSNHILQFKVNETVKLSYNDSTDPITTGGYCGFYAGVSTNTNGRANWAQFWSADTPDFTGPGGITGETAVAASGNRIDISWDTATNATHYIILGEKQTTPPTVELSARVTTPSYTHDSLSASTTYYYQIKAIDRYSNTGSASAVVNAETSASDGSAPSDPTGLVLTLNDTDQIPFTVNLDWDSNSEGDLDKYGIYVDDNFRRFETSSSGNSVQVDTDQRTVITVTALDKSSNESGETTAIVNLSLNRKINHMRQNR